MSLISFPGRAGPGSCVLGAAYQGTKARGRVGLTWTMVESRTVDRQCPKDRAKHRMMHALAPARLPAVWTGALLLEIRVQLPLHHDFLQGLEHRFALD